MKFIRSCALALVAVVAVPAAAVAQGSQNEGAVQRFELDVAHTSVAFMARHMMVTNVRGGFNSFRGHIDLDTEDVTRSKVYVEIDVASIDTRNQRRDDHLRSDDFFSAAQYPTITFLGERVEREGDTLILHGHLTIRDVTRPVAIPFELTGPITAGGRDRIGAEGELRIDRFEYGVQWNDAMETGGLVVGPEIRILLNVAAVAPRQ